MVSRMHIPVLRIRPGTSAYGGPYGWVEYGWAGNGCAGNGWPYCWRSCGLYGGPTGGSYPTFGGGGGSPYGFGVSVMVVLRSGWCGPVEATCALPGPQPFDGSEPVARRPHVTVVR